MKMTEMFIVSSRSRRLLLLSGFETADFGPIEGVLGGHPFFPRSVYRLELCVKWLRNRQFKFHYSVFFSLHDMRKQGKTRRKKAGIERNSHFSPSSPFLSPPLSTPAA